MTTLPLGNSSSSGLLAATWSLNSARRETVAALADSGRAGMLMAGHHTPIAPGLRGEAGHARRKARISCGVATSYAGPETAGGDAMAWIKTVPFPEATGKLLEALEGQQKLYPKEYDRAPDDTGSRSVVATHTLIPEALYHAFATFGVLMSPDLPLTRAQHEMITTRVSAVNRCHY